jgi:hypothetical protein
VLAVLDNSTYPLGAKVLAPGFNPLIELPQPTRLIAAAESEAHASVDSHYLARAGCIALGSALGLITGSGIGGAAVYARTRRVS